MSFHGGCLGVIIAIAWFSWKHGLNFLRFGDRITVAVPIGLFLGRCANFINGELWGRPAPPSFPWAMVYPGDPLQLPRFPSELIEAGLEGIVLFAIMLFAARFAAVRAKSGLLAGIFLSGYAVARICSEFFREPDAFLGFLPFGTTMGQILCLPMLAAGIGLAIYAIRRPASAA
jgi:phosphatidylglycerol:prolipoprotein diacylglycerol transferase